ncbi:hypothetical protein V6N13_098002 [Hibiscus sabdariffa]|uniref:Uncharacterized protein n=1 Tax=Hibiscus sabdariffa TaxID=183260 RepID=A0ABR2NVJ8_9ROSI
MLELKCQKRLIPMSWACPDDIFLSTSLATYLDSSESWKGSNRSKGLNEKKSMEFLDFLAPPWTWEIAFHFE